MIEQVVNDLNVEDTTGTGEAGRRLFNDVGHRIITGELGVDIHLIRPNTVTKKVRHINAEETAIESCRVLRVVSIHESASHEVTCQFGFQNPS